MDRPAISPPRHNSAGATPSQRWTRQTCRHCRELNCVVTVDSKCTSPLVVVVVVVVVIVVVVVVERSSNCSGRAASNDKCWKRRGSLMAPSHIHVLAHAHRTATLSTCNAPDTTDVGALFYMNTQVNVFVTQMQRKRRSSHSKFGR
jgi:hypothetical protein